MRKSFSKKMQVIALTTLIMCDTTWAGMRNELPRDGNEENAKSAISHGGQILTKSLPRVTSPFNIPGITSLSVNSLPDDQRLMPSIGNGHVATVIRGDAVFMNGLYNGHNITSHRAKMPAVFIRNINSSSFQEQRFTLDFAAGMFVEEIAAKDVSVKIKMFAHRTIKQLLVTMVTVQNAGSANVRLGLNSSRIADTEDLDITHAVNQSIGIISGRTKEMEYDVTGLQDVTMVHTVIPEEISVEPFQKTTRLFLLSVDLDPTTAKKSFDKGVQMFFNGNLESSHVSGWADVWRNGRIDLNGNDTLATLAYSSLYYIISSLPLGPTPDFVGLSPGDLAHGEGHQDYMGHVFWDQETWMYPPILLLHSKMGEAIVQTRVRTLDAAIQTAKMRGYKGAMYPWETALSGLDVTEIPIYFLNEQHITGDISFALRQYLYMTRDIRFLKESGIELVQEIAEFWASRVFLNYSTNMYEIHDVMPPDEWHKKVNNSAFTNAVAKLSLLLPEFVGNVMNIKPDPKYKAIADKMYIPYDKQLDYHPEFDGYTKNEPVKQADVVLMGFPLMINMDESTRRNDFRIYEAVTSKGPAMTWSMFSIGNLEIGDITKASTQFTRQLLNVAKPFNVWTELDDGTGAVNFITGMGGFLQSLLFGYGGFRLRPDRIDFHGRLPPSTSSFNITGLDYLGGSIDFYFTKDTTIVRLTKAAEFTLTLKYEEKAFTLKQNEIQMFSSTKASIVPDLPLTLDRNSANHVLFSSVLLIISALFCSKLYIC